MLGPLILQARILSYLPVLSDVQIDEGYACRLFIAGSWTLGGMLPLQCRTRDVACSLLPPLVAILVDNSGSRLMPLI